jgi:hypothetical protein
MWKGWLLVSVATFYMTVFTSIVDFVAIMFSGITIYKGRQAMKKLDGMFGGKK